MDRIGPALFVRQPQYAGAAHDKHLSALLSDFVHGERRHRSGHIENCLNALIVKPLSGERCGNVGLVLVVREDDLYGTPENFAAEVVDRHARGGELSPPQ